jgi:hypothetical protein
VLLPVSDSEGYAMFPERISPRPEFDRRRKTDQIFDSICLHCCATIATSASEVALDKKEASHLCWQRQEKMLRACALEWRARVIASPCEEEAAEPVVPDLRLVCFCSSLKTAPVPDRTDFFDNSIGKQFPLT